MVALLNRSDKHREAVAKIYTRYQTILLPQTVLAEVAYMIGREAGTATVVTLLRSLPTSHFHLTALTDQDVKRVSDILEKYADSRIDFVDASVSESLLQSFALYSWLGIKWTIYLLVVPNSIIIIDELELHLHPPLQQTLVRVLPKLGHDNQFIFTSHSNSVVVMFDENENQIIRLPNV